MLHRLVLIICLALCTDLMARYTSLGSEQFAGAVIASHVTYRWSPMVRWIHTLTARLDLSQSARLRAHRPVSCPTSTVHRVCRDRTETLTDQCLS